MTSSVSDELLGSAGACAALSLLLCTLSLAAGPAILRLLLVGLGVLFALMSLAVSAMAFRINKREIVLTSAPTTVHAPSAPSSTA